MPFTIQLLRKRDNKERQLDAIKEQERTNKEQLVRIEGRYKTMFDSYQTWKKEQGVEGIKY